MWDDLPSGPAAGDDLSPVLEPLSALDEEAGRKLRNGGEEPRRRCSSTSGSGSSSGSIGKTKKRAGYQLRMLPILAACTMVFGPFGTIITFMLLPDDHSWRLRQSDGSDGQQEGMPSLEVSLPVKPMTL